MDRANSYISHADYFIRKVNVIKSISDVRNDQILTEFVVASCMLSKKSLSHLSVDIQNEIIEKLIDFKRLTDQEYLRALERRYFLTSGDSLGGTMRNAIGQFAQEMLTESLIARLQALNMSPERVLNKDKKTTGIKWPNRQAIFDKKPLFVNKSVDIIILKGESAKSGSLEKPGDYVCCGELKGGIDPAGADEHWKTAKTALERIVSSFNAVKIATPKLIFVGAAIETAMANEIFGLLESGWLAGVANINYADQFNELIDIIIS